MKSFFTICLIFVTLFAVSIPATAQGFKAVGGGLEIALPMGNFGDVAGTGFGATIHGQYGWKPNIDLIAQLGYIKWGGKTMAGFDYSYHAIPIQVGGKYFFNQTANRFYAGALLGFHMFGWSYDYNLPFYGHTSGSSSTTKFSFAPLAGYEMKLGEKMILDLSARYQIISDLSFLGIHAGILYPLH
jgi:opacity protein-like surface antigen